MLEEVLTLPGNGELVDEWLSTTCETLNYL